MQLPSLSLQLTTGEKKAHLIAINNTINTGYQGKLQRAYKA
jgi:hypothetical protein